MLIENINETKDLRSGIVFEYRGVILKIVSGEKACSECYFNDSRKCRIIPCLGVSRKFGDNIIFKEISHE